MTEYSRIAPLFKKNSGKVGANVRKNPSDMEEVSRDVAKHQSEFLALFFFAMTGAEAVAVTKRRLDAISKYGIYNGNTKKQMFDRLSAGDAERIFDIISDMAQKNMPVDAVLEAVNNELVQTGRNVKKEIEAIINGVANDAALEFAAANKTSLLYSAVLDDRVCAGCAALDGTVYAYDDEDLPSLPRHYQCRCSLVPFTEETGRIEPASFREYVESLTPQEQESRLGRTKFNAWRSGRYDLRKYETPGPGQRLSLAELVERYKEALAKTMIDFDPHKIMTITAPASLKSVISLRIYTCGEDNMYRKINSYMLGGPTVQKNKYIEWIIDGIDSFMDVSTIAKDQFVYRGIKSSVFYDQLIGGQLEMPIKFYQSTSLSKDVASRYAGHVQGESVLTKILLHAGTNCVDVSKISAAPNPEEEILVNATGKLFYKSLYYDWEEKQLVGYAVYEK